MAQGAATPSASLEYNILVSSYIRSTLRVSRVPPAQPPWPERVPIRVSSQASSTQHRWVPALPGQSFHRIRYQPSGRLWGIFLPRVPLGMWFAWLL